MHERVVLKVLYDLGHLVLLQKKLRMRVFAIVQALIDSKACVTASKELNCCRDVCLRTFRIVLLVRGQGDDALTVSSLDDDQTPVWSKLYLTH